LLSRLISLFIVTEQVDLQVTVFAVGVGTKIRDSELTAIASTPKSNHVYYLASFRDITSFANQIMTGACKGNTETAV